MPLNVMDHHFTASSQGGFMLYLRHALIVVVQVLARSIVFRRLASFDLGRIAPSSTLDSVGFEGVPLFRQFSHAFRIRCSGIRHSLNVARLSGRLRAEFVVLLVRCFAMFQESRDPHPLGYYLQDAPRLLFAPFTLVFSPRRVASCRVEG